MTHSISMKILGGLGAVLLFAASPTQAGAADAFVVASEGADMAVGSPVTPESAVTIEADGHVVVMDATGRMMRRDGPFSGTMAEGVGLGEAAGGEPVNASVIDALVDLARTSSRSRDQLLASRSMEGATARLGPFTIRARQDLYCHRADVRPTFVLANPPARDRALTLDRYDAPVFSETGRWKAGAGRFDWPADWPEPKAGRYRWSLGDLSEEFRVEVYRPRAPADDILAASAELSAIGCDAQAAAGLAAAMAAAEVVD